MPTSSTLFRKARSEKNATKAAKMRKQAAKLRREERAAKRAVQKRVATANKRLASQRKHVAAKVSRKRRTVERITLGLKDVATFIATDGREVGEWVAGEPTATAEVLNEKMRQVELEARHEGERVQMQNQNDDIVCSLISMIKHACGMPRHAPWEISGAEMRAVIDVLERAGYSEFGRIDTAAKGPSATNAAS